MSGYEYEHDHQHEHEHEHHQEHGPEHAGDDRLRDDRAQDGGPGAARLFEAAAAGRTDVVGASGLGALQRAVGNGAVGAMVQRSRSAADEDATAEGGAAGGTAGGAGGRSPVHDVLASGGGQPLDAATRGDMEARMGADFSDVRIHTDAAADASAKGIGAHAYTVGNDVVFQRDAYDPASPQGRTTLAHELTHVIQQRSGPVEGTEAPGGIRVSDPSDRFEREAVSNAERVMAEPPAAAAPEPVSATASTPASVSSPAASAAPAVQRSAEDEDEQPADVQGSFVQRAAESGAEEEEEAPAAG